MAVLKRLAPLLIAPLAWGAAPVPTEYEVKAAFLYNFGRFVEWPAAEAADTPAREPFVIGVLGEDQFDGLLERMLRGKTVRDRPVVVKHFARVTDLDGTDVLFVAPSQQARLEAALAAAAAKRPRTLTVGEGDDFTRRGGMIAFVVRDRKVRFEVNLAEAERSGLKISSELLKLAVLVRGD